METSSQAVKKNERQRRHTRVLLPYSFLVAWQGGGRRDASRARNLGAGGICICATEPLHPGEFLQMLFDTPQGEVRARGIVRSTVSGRGMGVEFLSMDAIAKRRLQGMLRSMIG